MSQRPSGKAALEAERLAAETAQLVAERKRADSERKWFDSKGAAEIEQLQAEATRAASETENFRARREKTLLESEIIRRDLAEDDADTHFARTYTLQGPVDRESIGDCLETLSHWARRFPGQPITLQICTEGGDLFDGLALFGFVRQLVSSGTEVTTVGLGWGASMGGILLQCGSHRVLDRDAYLMIHAPVTGWFRSHIPTHEVHDEAKLLERLWEHCSELLAERSTLSAEEIRQRAERRDWWAPAGEALALGLCDEVR